MSINLPRPFTQLFPRTSAMVSHTWNAAKTRSLATANWAKAHLAQIWAIDLKPKWANKYIDSYIRPLDTIDAIIMSACGAVALGVVLIVMPILGKAFIAFGVIGCAAILLCGGALVRHRSKTKLSEEACGHLDTMIAFIRDPMPAGEPINQLQIILNLLKNKKYEHIDKIIERLQDSFDSFNSKYEGNQERANTFRERLKGFKMEILPYST